MKIQQLLQSKVSCQKAIWLPVEQEFTVREVLDQIKSMIHRENIERLRQLLDRGHVDAYHLHKRNLPAVTFCGLFDKHRRKKNLRSYNPLMVIDIDKLEPAEFERIRGALESDPYVFAFWVSPSGNGFKGLVGLDYRFDLTGVETEWAHKGAFNDLVQYFLNEYQILLDESGSDITRLCFLSYDPRLMVKEHARPFEVAEQNFEKKWLSKAEPEAERDRGLLQHKNHPEDKARMEDIIRFLSASETSITASYEQWFRVAYGLAEAFTFKTGLNYYLALCILDGGRYDEKACRNMFHYCYKNSTGKTRFNTIIFYAVKEGYKYVSTHGKQTKDNNERNRSREN